MPRKFQSSASSLTGIKPLFSNLDTLTLAFNDNSKRKEVETSLLQFASLSATQRPTMVEAGEIFTRFLEHPLDTQKAFVAVICADLGIDAPSYERVGAGRPTTGRIQLATVVYYQHPEMLEMVANGKDTKAGAMVSACIAMYKATLVAVATAPRTTSTQRSTLTKRQLRMSFGMLMEVVQTADEEALVIALFQRAGVETAVLDTWSTEMEAATAAAHQQAA